MAVKDSKPILTFNLDELEKKAEAGAWNPKTYQPAIDMVHPARSITRSMIDADITNENILQEKEKELKTHCENFKKYLTDNDFVVVKKNLVTKDGKFVADAFVAPKEYEALEKFAAQPGPEQKRAVALLNKINDQCIARHEILAPCVKAYEPGYYQKKIINRIPERTIREIQHKTFKISEVRRTHPELKGWCDKENKRLAEKEKSLAMTFGRKAAWFGVGGVPAAGVATGIVIGITIVATGGIAAVPVVAAAIGCGIFFGLAAVDKANSQHKEGKENAFVAFVNRQLDRFSKKTKGDSGQKESVAEKGVDETPKHAATPHTSQTDIARGLKGPHSAEEIAGASPAVITDEVSQAPVKKEVAAVTVAPEVKKESVSLYSGVSSKDKDINNSFKTVSDIRKKIEKDNKEHAGENNPKDVNNGQALGLIKSLEELRDKGVSRDGIQAAKDYRKQFVEGPSLVDSGSLKRNGQLMTQADIIIERAEERLPAEPSHRMRPGG